MADDVVLHIGQPKTGTTSLQNLLAENRTWLAQHGVEFPDMDGRSAHHRAAADLQVLGGYFASMQDDVMEDKREQFADAWAALLAAVARAEGRVVISSEGLCFLDPAGVARALSDLRAVTRGPVRVVISYREVDELLVSYYFERSKYSLQPPFPDYLRTALNDLTSEELGRLSWVSVPRLCSLWERADEVILVRMDTSDSAAMDALVKELVGVRLTAQDKDRHNVGSSLTGLLAWRMFLTGHRGLSRSGMDRVRLKVYGRHPVAADRRLGGSIDLTASAKSAIRDSLPQTGSSVTSMPAVLAALQARPEQTLEVSIPEGFDLRGETIALYRLLKRELLIMRVRSKARNTIRRLGRAL